MTIETWRQTGSGVHFLDTFIALQCLFYCLARLHASDRLDANIGYPNCTFDRSLDELVVGKLDPLALPLRCVNKHSDNSCLAQQLV